MTKFTALLDACSLVPIVQADTLLRLAEAGLYRPLWSNRILAEVVAALEKIHPDMKRTKGAINRVSTMNRFFDDALVEGWESLETGIDLPDKDDAHVVAAAIRGRADVIVTENVKDFPAGTLSSFGLDVQTTDEFLLNQLDLDPSSVMGCLKRQSKAMNHPEKSVGQILELLGKCGVKGFSDAASKQLWRFA